MADGNYYRKQAQLFASLAIATSDPRIAERYNQMALEHLAKAEEVEPSRGRQMQALHGGDSGDIERD